VHSHVQKENYNDNPVVHGYIFICIDNNQEKKIEMTPELVFTRTKRIRALAFDWLIVAKEDLS
jgi:hypothetical protein